MPDRLRTFSCILMNLLLVAPAVVLAQSDWEVVAIEGDPIGRFGVKPWHSVNDAGEIAFVVDNDSGPFSEDLVVAIDTSRNERIIATGGAFSDVIVSYSLPKIDDDGYVYYQRSAASGGFFGTTEIIQSTAPSGETAEYARAPPGIFDEIFFGSLDVSSGGLVSVSGVRAKNGVSSTVVNARRVGGSLSWTSATASGRIDDAGAVYFGSGGNGVYSVETDAPSFNVESLIEPGDGFSSVSSVRPSSDGLLVVFTATLSPTGASAINDRQGAARLEQSGVPFEIPAVEPRESVFAVFRPDLPEPLVYESGMGEVPIDRVIAVQGDGTYSVLSLVTPAPGQSDSLILPRVSVESDPALAFVGIDLAQSASLLTVGDSVPGAGVVDTIRLDDSLSNAGVIAVNVNATEPSSGQQRPAILRGGAEPIDPAASYIMVLSHGQVPRAVLPCLNSFTLDQDDGHCIESPWFDDSDPPWVMDGLAHISDLVRDINDLRRSEPRPEGQELLPVEFLPVVGHWAQNTTPGLGEIATSRMLWIAPLAGSLPLPVELAAVETARTLELKGRLQAQRAFESAAQRIASDTEAAILRARQGRRPEHPVFVDILGHSRGGAISSRVLEILSDRGVLELGPTEVTLTLVDAIDPSSDDTDLTRPLANAGWLLRDRRICRRGNERITSVYAEFALFDPTSEGFLPEPIQTVLFTAAGLLDAGLTAIGLPRGHSRDSLFAVDPHPEDRNELIPGTTHITINTQILIDGISSLTVPPIGHLSQVSIADTTSLGALLRDPLLDVETLGVEMPYLPGSASLCDQPVRQLLEELSGGTGNLIQEPTFRLDPTISSAFEVVANSAEIENTIVSLGGVAVVPLLAVPAERPEDLLGWQFDAACVDVTEGVRSYIDLSCDFGAPAAQPIGAPALSGGVRLAVEFRLLEPASVLRVRVRTRRASYEATFDATNTESGEDARFEVCLAGVLGLASDPTITDVELSGDRARVYRVDLFDELCAPACRADLNADGTVSLDDLNILLSEYGACRFQLSADLNGDGCTDFVDLTALLSSMQDPCTPDKN